MTTIALPVLSSTDTPTFADKTAAAEYLLATAIPYSYRAAVSREENLHRHVTGTRPSTARIAWQHQAGIVNGYENTVKDLFGFFFHNDGRDVLRMAVELLDDQQSRPRLDPLRPLPSTS